MRAWHPDRRQSALAPWIWFWRVVCRTHCNRMAPMIRLLVVIAALWLCVTPSAQAADFCVGSATQLRVGGFKSEAQHPVVVPVLIERRTEALQEAHRAYANNHQESVQVTSASTATQKYRTNESDRFAGVARRGPPARRVALARFATTQHQRGHAFMFRYF